MATLTDATIALLAYRLARRHAPESYALGAWLAVAGAMAFPFHPGPNPPALALAFGGAARGSQAAHARRGARRARRACFRFEIGVAAILGMLLEGPPGTRLRSLTVAVLVALASLAPFFVVAPGAMYPRHDRVLLDPEPAAAPVPARLPRPAPSQQADRVLHPTDPGGLVRALGLAVALALRRRLAVAPRATSALHGGIAASASRARGFDPSLLSLGPLAVVGLAYLLGRTDLYHLVPLSPVLAVALAGAAAVTEWRALRVALLVGLALIALHGLDRRAGQLLHPGTLAAVPGPAGDGVQTGAADARALGELERTGSRSTRPGEPIFVANPRFDLVQAGDPLLYIILGHPNPTSYDVMQPGLVTTAPVQRQIIA